MQTYLLKPGRQVIGRAGDVNETAVAVNIAKWLEDYPTGIAQLMVTTPGGQRIPLTVTVEDGLMVAVLPDTVTVGPGLYVYTAVMTNGSTQVQTARFECIILGSELAQTWKPLGPRVPDWAERIFVAADVIERAMDGAIEARTTAVDKAAEAQASAEAAADSEGAAALSAQSAAASASDAQDILDNVVDQGAAQVSAIVSTGETVLDSIPADYTALDVQVDGISEKLDDLLQTGDEIVPLGAFEPGGINGQGAPNNSTSATTYNRRSKAFLPLPESTVTVHTKNGITVYFRVFNESGAIVGSLTAGSGSTIDDTPVQIDMSSVGEGAAKYKIVLAVATNEQALPNLSTDNVRMVLEHKLVTDSELDEYDDGIQEQISALNTSLQGQIDTLSAAVNNKIFVNTAALLEQYNDFDALPNNSVIAYTTSAANANNCPTGFTTGLLLTYQVNVVRLQVVFLRTAQKIAFRYYWSGWKDWIYFDNADSVASAIQAAVSAITVTLPKPEYLSLFKNCACIGDSLTRGYYQDKPSGDRNRDYGYPNALARMTGLNVWNLGLSGADAAEWMAESTLAAVDYTQFDLAFICLGENSLSTTNKAAYQEQYLQIIQRLKTANANMTVFCLGIPTLHSSRDAIIQEFVAAAAATYTGVYFLDINSVGLYKNAHSSDNIHFTALGYMLLAQSIKTAAEQYIDEHPENFASLEVPKTTPSIIAAQVY